MFGFDQDMIFRIPALLIALTVHEYAHARVAVLMGDPTPKVLGRQTLNPVAHLDPIGLLMLWLVQFGWAKPVPINPNNFRDWRKGMILVSFAGPGTNILVAFIAALLIALLGQFHLLSDGVYSVLRLTYVYNLTFAIFNLVPIPPLDGSKILSSLLPGRYAEIFDRIEPYGTFILIALIYIGVIGSIIYPITSLLDLIIRSILYILL
ncbi:hypothetical protein SDC9_05860 [bioreactor metagenome]|uniref:Peptidase M50 domain-containing protein n=1 Tax=bioreactor metagenome TaxID=1076179 RepID=A0A644T259_9ZZZZ|nr:site-2 protease family protein [Negativicutes bacterium]